MRAPFFILRSHFTPPYPTPRHCARLRSRLVSSSTVFLERFRGSFQTFSLHLPSHFYIVSRSRVPHSSLVERERGEPGHGSRAQDRPNQDRSSGEDGVGGQRGGPHPGDPGGQGSSREGGSTEGRMRMREVGGGGISVLAWGRGRKRACPAVRRAVVFRGCSWVGCLFLRGCRI